MVHRPSEQNLAHLDVFRQFFGMLKLFGGRGIDGILHVMDLCLASHISQPADWTVYIVVLLFYSCTDEMATYLMAKKGYMWV
jgi:hypothetical protein